MAPEQKGRPGNGVTPEAAAQRYPLQAADERCRLCGQEALCGGVGWLLSQAPPGEPRPNQPLRCSNFSPKTDGERHSLLLRRSNLSALADKRFENFDTKVSAWGQKERDAMGEAVKVARNFAELPIISFDSGDLAEAQDWSGWVKALRDQRCWLLIRGDYGSGKTHLAAAIGNRWLERGGQVFFLTSPDLLDHLRSTFGPNSEIGYDALFQEVRNASLLILDDFGTEYASTWAREKLFQLFNHRHIHRLPTVLTTNLSLYEDNGLDERLRSRLLDTELVSHINLPVSDYRDPSKMPAMIQPLREMLEFCPDYHFAGFYSDTGANPGEQQTLKRAKRRAEQYAAAPSGWLLLIGGHGSGKTHLAAAIVKELQQRGEEALFASVADLLDHLRATFDERSTTTLTRLFRDVRGAGLLVLDGLGHESSTAWGQEKIFQILDHRHMRNLPTVITSVKPPEEHGARLRSRLLAAECFEIQVTSYFERINPPGQSRLT